MEGRRGIENGDGKRDNEVSWRDFHGERKVKTQKGSPDCDISIMFSMSDDVVRFSVVAMSSGDRSRSSFPEIFSQAS